MRRILDVILLAALINGASLVLGQSNGVTSPKSSGRAVRQPLTLKQVEGLISIKTPDNVVAQEIQSRGIKEAVTKQVVREFQQKGADAQTVNALSSLIARSTLALRTTGGAEVILDHAAVPTVVGPNGEVSISDLDPGLHTLEIRKQNFKQWSSTVQLAPNKTTELSQPLEWSIGFLAVETTPDSVVEITPLGRFNGGVKQMAVPIGQYTMTVSGPFRKTLTKPIQIVGGEALRANAILELDREAVGELCREASDSYEKKTYQVAVERGQRCSSLLGRDKDALGIVALSYLQLGDVNLFIKAAKDALAAGGELKFSLVHSHPLSGSHPADLVITTEIRFDPQGKCSVKALAVPFSAGVGRAVFASTAEASVADWKSIFDPAAARTRRVIDVYLPDPSVMTKTNKTRPLKFFATAYDDRALELISQLIVVLGQSGGR